MKDYEAICKDHAAEIITFLEYQTSGNLRECRDIANSEHASTDSDLWLAVTLNLQTMLRQRLPCLVSSDGHDDDLPF